MLNLVQSSFCVFVQMAHCTTTGKASKVNWPVASFCHNWSSLFSENLYLNSYLLPFRPSDDSEWRLSCDSRAEPNNLWKISRKTVEPERGQRNTRTAQRPGQIWSLKAEFKGLGLRIKFKYVGFLKNICFYCCTIFKLKIQTKTLNLNLI